MFTTKKEVRDWSRTLHRDGKRIGFVPTMGALHEGHLSLVRVAQRENEAVLVSIFVNPTQFGPNEDFTKYPRTQENDLAMLENLGEIAVFAPSVEEMYPFYADSRDAKSKHFESCKSGADQLKVKHESTFITVPTVADSLEGAIRPGHFCGVATVVLKLFGIACADAAYFGQKDYQQVCVIKKMVSDLDVPIDIVVCPIVREKDGLAMSSRNRYLSAKQRQEGVALSRSLYHAADLIESKQCHNVRQIKAEMNQILAESADLHCEYIAICDPNTLEELSVINSRQNAEIVILIAAKIGSTRLIDNVLVSL
ncbi:MAG: pantoate--beta-alanine ligase [Thermoguttaceae bacterium]